MRGDIDNTQPVRLDGSPSARARVVYGVRDLPAQRMQFGTVEVDYGHVAVWRPYDPQNQGHDAPWRSGTWRNVYRIRLPLDQPGSQPGKAMYGLAEFDADGVRPVLPRVELVLSYRLREHLARL